MHVTSKGLRDLFFLIVGTAILYRQFWQLPEPSPLGVFVALFLFGLIPAFRADAGSAPGPLAVLMQLLGGLGGKANPDTLAEQEARVEQAEQVAKDRAAVRAALVDRVGPEAAARIDVEKRSRPESGE